mmetsp:Transcript_57891/g.126876  ORF Transcript_57891/g.126876 Transcript_57891/m.126876 type:complete len:243 (-) Transcript_57891:334-1062(-)
MSTLNKPPPRTPLRTLPHFLRAVSPAEQQQQQNKNKNKKQKKRNTWILIKMMTTTKKKARAIAKKATAEVAAAAAAAVSAGGDSPSPCRQLLRGHLQDRIPPSSSDPLANASPQATLWTAMTMLRLMTVTSSMTPTTRTTTTRTTTVTMTRITTTTTSKTGRQTTWTKAPGGCSNSCSSSIPSCRSHIPPSLCEEGCKVHFLELLTAQLLLMKPDQACIVVFILILILLIENLSKSPLQTSI